MIKKAMARLCELAPWHEGARRQDSRNLAFTFNQRDTIPLCSSLSQDIAERRRYCGSPDNDLINGVHKSRRNYSHFKARENRRPLLDPLGDLDLDASYAN